MIVAKHPPIDGDPCYVELANGNYLFDYVEALLIMLREDVCHFGSGYHPDKQLSPESFITIGVYVGCNDLFYWASADAECVSFPEVEDLYRSWLDDPKWGAWVWCCKRRKLQPQAPVKRDMIEDGVWTGELEALPVPAPS